MKLIWSCCFVQRNFLDLVHYRRISWN